MGYPNDFFLDDEEARRSCESAQPPLYVTPRTGNDSDELIIMSESPSGLLRSSVRSRRHQTFLAWYQRVLQAFYLIAMTFVVADLCRTDLARLERWNFEPLPANAHARALKLLSKSPIIDGHIDLPILMREYYRNQFQDVDMTKEGGIKGHVDLPRLRKGKVGGFFWSTYVGCPEDAGYPIDNHGNFTIPTFRVRDTLEQIDVAKLLINKYSDVSSQALKMHNSLLDSLNRLLSPILKDFELTLTSKAWRKAMKKGRIGGMLGVEGGHQLGSSLSSLRAFYELGARYVTLTHTCHNALADSCGMQGTPIEPRWNGISEFGKKAIREMNRLGMMVDLSHTSPATASQALSLSQSPVIFSHSNARGVHSVVRNVPDTILRRIGKLSFPNRRFDLTQDGEGGQGWGNDTNEVDLPIPGGDVLIMLNFSPAFISETSDGKGPRASIKLLADHADYIGRLAGRSHVGIGSDFDGIISVPIDLPDVSYYPDLLAELIERGWSDNEIRGLASENLLRVLEGVERVKHQMRHMQPENAIFEGRNDLRGTGRRS
ncbi:BZ3500_MvSof-1268-A1-R1_Chr1-3g01805 [Microbotryum saponariae]|uniref:Dipeptidase n=1 Tax=Microbotryum saponariae TaxID=289078 RepID=A0A2X0L719_9BASI|nr:BZ3500_MvSof-1268-A1-R1_Chr1-3g01805 [Microbotryum saponariae]SCZ94621.1 BZ3501_MvSof-1269-A2-R1_Chr1-3g01407 [Microbotryum saponariae]